MGLNGETLLDTGNVHVGWVPNQEYGYNYPAARGLRVTVRAEMERRTRQPEYETIFHTMTSEPTSFTLTTAVRRPDNQDWAQGGATIEPLREPLRLAPGFTRPDIDELIRLHERYHLNSLKAACAHQVVPEIPAGVTDPTGWLLANVPPCPETGYKWGTGWLLEPLPDYLTPQYVRGLLHLEDPGDAT